MRGAAGLGSREMVMEELIAALSLLAAAGGVVFAGRRVRTREHTRSEEALEPVRRLAFEDVTAFGEDLARLDIEIVGLVLDEGATADYQRALDAYDSAKLAGDSIGKPEDIRHLTQIIEDGRYAIACVRARVSGEPLPSRRPPCFFDPRHGLSVVDVSYTPADGVERQVPACALDAERVNAGAEPDTRKVLVNGSRVPYWNGGPAYQPYALGYFGADALTWLFIGNLAFSNGTDGYQDGYEDGYQDGGGSDGGGNGGGDGGFFGDL